MLLGGICQARRGGADFHGAGNSLAHGAARPAAEPEAQTAARGVAKAREIS